MMGSDIETILSQLNQIKVTTGKLIKQLAGMSGYRLGVDPLSHLEVPNPAAPPPPISYCASLISLGDALAANASKLSSLQIGMFTSGSSFTNGIGSPWTEMEQLQNAIRSVGDYGASLSWVGTKAGLMGLLNHVVSCAVDAKWAIVSYHDWIQRGFDHVYNGDTPSITHTADVNGSQSIGQGSQSFTDNVSIPAPSLDPF